MVVENPNGERNDADPFSQYLSFGEQNTGDEHASTMLYVNKEEDKALSWIYKYLGTNVD